MSTKTYELDGDIAIGTDYWNKTPVQTTYYYQCLTQDDKDINGSTQADTTYWAELDFVDDDYDIYYVTSAALYMSVKKSDNLASPEILVKYSTNEGSSYTNLADLTGLTTSYNTYSRSLSVNEGNINDMRIKFGNDGTYRLFTYENIRRTYISVNYTSNATAKRTIWFANYDQDPNYDGSYKVDWAAITGDSYYRLYHRLDGSSYTYSTTSSTYEDISGAKYGRHDYYLVNYNEYGSPATASDMKSIYVCRPATSVSISDSLRDQGKLTINWANIVGNDPYRWEVSIYNGTSWSGYTSVAGNLRTHTFTGLTNRLPYKLKVRARTYYGGVNRYSNTVETTTKYVANGWQGTIMGRTNPLKVCNKNDHEIVDYVCGVLDDDNV